MKGVKLCRLFFKKNFFWKKNALKLFKGTFLKRLVGNSYLNSHNKSGLNGNKTLNNTIKFLLKERLKKTDLAHKNMARSVLNFGFDQNRKITVG